MKENKKRRAAWGQRSGDRERKGHLMNEKVLEVLCLKERCDECDVLIEASAKRLATKLRSDILVLLHS